MRRHNHIYICILITFRLALAYLYIYIYLDIHLKIPGESWRSNWLCIFPNPKRPVSPSSSGFERLVDLPASKNFLHPEVTPWPRTPLHHGPPWRHIENGQVILLTGQMGRVHICSKMKNFTSSDPHRQFNLRVMSHKTEKCTRVHEQAETGNMCLAQVKSPAGFYATRVMSPNLP